MNKISSDIRDFQGNISIPIFLTWNNFYDFLQLKTNYICRLYAPFSYDRFGFVVATVKDQHNKPLSEMFNYIGGAKYSMHI